MTTTGINLEDEELEGGTPSSTASGAAKTATPKPPIIDEDDADFGNEDDYRRPGELDILKVQDKNTFARFSILPNPATGKAFMKKGYVHYVQGKGYARCLGKRDKKGQIIGDKPFCCKGKEADSRYVVLVVQYLSVNNRDGKFVQGQPVTFEIKALCLSRVGYKEISTLPEEEQKVTDLDITATPNENGKGLKFNRISSKASWKRQEALMNAVNEAIKPFLDGAELQRKVGKSINAAEMRVHLGVSTGVEDDGPGMDDLE